jgi:hypothetical protein
MVEEKALLAGVSSGRKRHARTYQCMWLASQDGAAARGESPLPASMRPDRSKVMIVRLSHTLYSPRFARSYAPPAKLGNRRGAAADSIVAVRALVREGD